MTLARDLQETPQITKNNITKWCLTFQFWLVAYGIDFRNSLCVVTDSLQKAPTIYKKFCIPWGTPQWRWGKKKTNMSNFMQMNYNPLVLLSSLQLQCSWTTTKLIHDYHIIDLNTENRWSIMQQETSTRLIWPQCKRLFIIMLLWYKWLCKSEKMLFSFPCAGLLIISGAIWCLGLGDQTITPQLMANPLHLSYSRLLWITIWRETATVVGVKWYWT